MRSQGGLKRRSAKGVGRALMAIGGLVAALSASALVPSPASAQDYPDGLIPEGNWTDDQIQYMLDKIDETERVLPDRFPASATYEELESTLGSMGFFEFGATASGGYDHWINPAWVADDTVMDPEFAESLVYQNTGNGVWELKSAMFMLHPNIGMSEIPDDIAWLPGWHGHPELCVGADGRFVGVTDPENPDCPEGSSTAATPLMMHVWLEDPGCGHRFGGVGVGGLHCDHGDHGGNHDGDHDGDHGGDHDGSDDHGDHGDNDHGGPGGNEDDHGDGGLAAPAPPISAAPDFTG